LSLRSPPSDIWLKQKIKINIHILI
jgi:hypothetical protein